ncbi:XRE family transcriptional regulator, partial [Candidatus Roizmanbacteria bacterium CG_4_10_14_0_2_um_filter_36_35]
MEFGALLRQYRLKSGVTLKKLTEVVSIDNTYLSKIENNLRSPPKRNIIIEI